LHLWDIVAATRKEEAEEIKTHRIDAGDLYVKILTSIIKTSMNKSCLENTIKF